MIVANAVAQKIADEKIQGASVVRGGIVMRKEGRHRILAVVWLSAFLLLGGFIECDTWAFNEAPMLTPLVEAGKLPPVDKRLPTSPPVVHPIENKGAYGGTWRRAYTGLSDLVGARKTRPGDPRGRASDNPHRHYIPLSLGGEHANLNPRVIGGRIVNVQLVRLRIERDTQVVRPEGLGSGQQPGMRPGDAAPEGKRRRAVRRAERVHSGCAPGVVTGNQ